jgi:hypothetical protein
MQSKARTPTEYYDTLPEERREVMLALRKVIAKNLPKGFAEVMQYGMPGWVVPHSLYPAGYHCDPKQPLPFLGVASQVQYVAVYHMGIYADPALLKWFQDEYARQATGKLDMGKSCIRFKQPDQIPLKLMGDLASRMTPRKWIELYEARLKR